MDKHSARTNAYAIDCMRSPSPSIRQHRLSEEVQEEKCYLRRLAMIARRCMHLLLQAAPCAARRNAPASLQDGAGIRLAVRTRQDDHPGCREQAMVRHGSAEYVRCPA